MIGALVPTFLISRFVLWTFRTWRRGWDRLVAAHVTSWLFMSFIGGAGMADGGAFAGLQAASLYAVPQLVWFIVDMIRDRRRTRSESGA